MKELLVGQECYTWACRDRNYVILHGVITEKCDISIAFGTISYTIQPDNEDDTIARGSSAVFDSYDACKASLLLLLQGWILERQQDVLEHHKAINEQQSLIDIYKQQIKRLEEQNEHETEAW